jgi:hypothetical protein
VWEVARALGQALDRVGSSLQRDLQGRAFGGDGSGTPAGVAKVRGSSRHAWRLPRTQHRVSGRKGHAFPGFCELLAPALSVLLVGVLYVSRSRLSLHLCQLSGLLMLLLCLLLATHPLRLVFDGILCRQVAELKAALAELRTAAPAPAPVPEGECCMQAGCSDAHRSSVVSAQHVIPPVMYTCHDMQLLGPSGQTTPAQASSCPPHCVRFP